MSLRSKIALALFLAVSVFVTVDRVLHRLNFSGRFDEADRHDALERLVRVEALLGQRVKYVARRGQELQTRLTDAGAWQAGGLASRAEELTAPGGLHLALVFDPKGRVALHRVVDPVTGKPLELRELPNEQLAPAHPLLRGWGKNRAPSGLWVTARGAVLVSGSRLEVPGRPPANLVVGRFLDETVLADLRSHSGVDVDVILVQGPTLTATYEQVMADIEVMQGPIVEEVDDQSLRAWSVVRDLGSRPAVLLSALAPRQHGALWAELQRYALTSSLAVAILFPFVILLLLQWIVTGPLSRLTSHALRIGQGSDMQARLDLDREDEIGQLAREFDAMLEKLARFREEVAQNARLAGMDEVSAGVMHNVGNVLNSVVTSARVSRKRLGQLNLDDLRVVCSKLEENQGGLDEYLVEDERGKHLLPFLAALVEDLESTAGSVGGELETLGEGIDHIANLVGALTQSSKRSGLVERLDLVQQLNSSIELCLLSFETGLQVEVVREFDELPNVMLDRHKLMEILVNLIRNALQAMQSKGDADMRLTVRLKREGEAQLRIEVADSGIGIAAEDLERVFVQGHTTKSDGHGLGLHLSANTATELGGQLSVDSAGLGQGATFTLRLPFTLPQQPSAAA